MSVDEEKELLSSGWTRVCPISDIPSGSRKTFNISNRVITLFHPQSRLAPPKPVPDYAKKLAPQSETFQPKIWKKPLDIVIYAMDEFCYHEGGPLSNGDIEDWNGIPCVKCPYHAYAIALENGERFLQDLSGGFKSLGIRQRTHQVRIENGFAWVKANKPSDFEDGDPRQKLACDRFQEGKLAKKPYDLEKNMKGAKIK
jgi:nitrite reductase/ring-hydroxylating ferredoxin subunit